MSKVALFTQSGPPSSWKAERLYAIKIRDLRVTFVARSEPRFVSVLELLAPELFGLSDATSIEGLSCDDLIGATTISEVTTINVTTPNPLFFIPRFNQTSQQV